MGKPTHHDAEIMLRLAEISALWNIEESMRLIWDPSFTPDPSKHAPDSHERQLVQRMLRWMETVGTLYRNGLFSEDLLFDWLAVTPSWERLKAFALEERERTSPAMWENFEYMAEKQRNWKPGRA